MTWLRSALQAENENDDSERLFLASRDDATIQPVSAQNNSKSWMLVLALIGSFVIGILTATLATLPRSANLRPGELGKWHWAKVALMHIEHEAYILP